MSLEASGMLFTANIPVNVISAWERIILSAILDLGVRDYKMYVTYRYKLRFKPYHRTWMLP